MLKCKKCGLEKTKSSFYKEKRTKRGYSARCKDCCKSDARAVFKANPEPYRKRARAAHCPTKRRERVLAKYDLTQEDYDAMLDKQGGHCGMCPATTSGHNASDNWCIDHCHETGKVRGLLCSRCNLLLGKARADFGNELLLSALFYLKRTQ